MKILRKIAMVALICCSQSIFTMQEEPHVQFNRVRKVKRYEPWITPGQDVVTQEEYQQALAETGLRKAINPNEAQANAMSLANEEYNTWVPLEERQRREERERQILMQQREQENMMAEQNWY